MANMDLTVVDGIGESPEGCDTNNGGCEHICSAVVNLNGYTSGHICSCRHGYIANPLQRRNVLVRTDYGGFTLAMI